jgi:hypothetical protein
MEQKSTWRAICGFRHASLDPLTLELCLLGTWSYSISTSWLPFSRPGTTPSIPPSRAEPSTGSSTLSPTSRTINASALPRTSSNLSTTASVGGNQAHQYKQVIKRATHTQGRYTASIRRKAPRHKSKFLQATTTRQGDIPHSKRVRPPSAGLTPISTCRSERGGGLV